MFFLVSFIKGKVNLSGSFHIQKRIRFLKLEALPDLSQSDLELITKVSQDFLHNPHRLFWLFLKLQPQRNGKNDLEVLEQDFIDYGVALRCSFEAWHILALD